MTRTNWAIAVLLLASACGEGLGNVKQEATRPHAVNHPGKRNDALRLAEQQTGLPREVVMALAYQQGRFESASPDDTPLRHDVVSDDPELSGDEYGGIHHFGPMYLSLEQVTAGARSAGLAEDAVRNDDAANILAGAAVLAEKAKPLTSDEDFETLAPFREALTRYLALEDSPAAGNLAIAEIHDLLRAGFKVTLDDGETLEVTGFGPALTTTARALGVGEYPAVQWIRSPNFSSRDGNPVRFVVVHDMEGFMSSAIAVFSNTARQSSAHYLTRASDGHIVQMVDEGMNAWHCGNGWYNRNSIGIEHEGFAGRPAGGGYYNETQYVASAQLVAAIATRYRIPIDRGHIFGHGNVPSSGAGGICSDAQANAAHCGGAGHHWDPGPYWDWGHYLDLVAKFASAPPPPPPAKKYEVLTGDFDGDGKTDLATISPNGGGGWAQWVAMELSGSGTSTVWSAHTPQHMRNGNGDADYRVLAADFNGDRKTDLATISTTGGGGWRDWVALELSTGAGFVSTVWRATTPIHMRNGDATRDYRVFAADFNGDGKADLATLSPNGGGGWADWVALELSTGAGFTSTVWSTVTSGHIRRGGPGGYLVRVGDFNGDQKADLLTVSPNGGGGWRDWYSMELSTGAGFVSTVWSSPTPMHMRNGGPDFYRVLVADFDGDGKDDVATVSPLGGGGWRDWIAMDLSTGGGFRSTVWGAHTPSHMRNGGTGDHAVIAADFNGDGKADLASITATGGGGWRDWVAMELSTGAGFRSTVWGANTPIHMRNGGGGSREWRVLVGDLDGNQKADLLTLSPNGGGGWADWFAVESSTGAGFTSWVRGAATPQHIRNGGF
ncbi:MAG: N-acetylmuramoyl-L-alanine amidase [Myxococcales bacterium]|nr:N-acetylmuramoyl-L-alanine amidase [Myxococcales bacterium]